QSFPCCRRETHKRGGITSAAKGTMEASSSESTTVYFCHVCMSRVRVRKTSTQELECRRCEQTFVEELLESVVGNAALAGIADDDDAAAVAAAAAGGDNDDGPA
ncbi:unnamed protein product, partial [Ectocarpus sp. 12 AP-2014]